MVLPEHIASQIAAGEVIERPASVVKELVENSIDAGATSIEIDVDSGCLNIRVADNGCGMEADDAVLAFQRHATSKLSSADDLWKLKTMGFRGEALPSIASVSRLTCYTRTAAADIGTKLESNNGTISTTKTGCAIGTVIEVNDLFYNVPARLQFLKKSATEFAHIQETIEAIAIAHPKISFCLMKSGQQVFKTSGSGDRSKAIVESGFLRSTTDLLEVGWSVGDQEDAPAVQIHGYVAKPTTFRGDRKGILTIVNNRPVRCFITQKALDYVFSDLIPRGRYPVAVLSINLDAAKLDVNVHPSKKEIRYLHGNEVYAAVQQALLKTVRGASALVEKLEQQFGARSDTGALPPSIRLDPREDRQPLPTQLSFNNPFNDRVAEPKFEGYSFAAKLPDVSVSLVSEDTEDAPLGTSRQGLATSALPLQWRLIGYLHCTYFLIESSAGLEIIEQHIAHERVLYEQFLAIAEQRSEQLPQSQRLITSVPLKLTAAQLQCLQANQELLTRLGFEFEIEDETCRCIEVPIELASSDYSTALQQTLESLEGTGSAQTPLDTIKSLACQSAIKNGMPLSENQIIELINRWYVTPRNDTCPHGRPIKLSFSMDQLFQKFHPA
jgi:DNA mismatch repair protein MutL